MEIDEQKWIESALAFCDLATRKNATILLVRCQDCNGDSDIAVTNATDANIIATLAKAMENKTEVD